jgi:hypothetical protein
MDIDMLAADWWILSTRSGKGSFFLDFNSATYRDSKGALSFPTCRDPTDVIHLPCVKREVMVNIAHCRPAKQWIRTSGPYLGLAPGLSLSQTSTKGLSVQLLHNGVIDTAIFSLRALSRKEGVLSTGGVTAVPKRRLVWARMCTRRKNLKERKPNIKRHRVKRPRVNEWSCP